MRQRAGVGHSSDCSCSSSSNCCCNAAIQPDRWDLAGSRNAGRSCFLKSCCCRCNCFHIELLLLLLLLLLYQLNLTCCCLDYDYYCSLMLAVHHYGISVVYDNITWWYICPSRPTDCSSYPAHLSMDHFSRSPRWTSAFCEEERNVTIKYNVLYKLVSLFLCIHRANILQIMIVILVLKFAQLLSFIRQNTAKIKLS